MLKSKTMDRITCIAVVVMLAVSILMWGTVESVRGDGSHTVGYEGLLFDKSVVHTIDIKMDDWDSFIANATAEEYTDCNVTIDGESYSHAAIRAKGNTSLSSVATLGSSRYSFKIEFNHFVKGMTYHGLDKLSLNNLIQDATMMKDYLAYTLMGRMGVPSSLCSYVRITVNGEFWGLYLAVEGVEDAFMDRNGMTRGELYKPDSLSFGGGRGNGGGFDIEQFRVKDEEEESPSETETAEPETAATPETTAQQAAAAQADGEGASFGGSSGMPAGTTEGAAGNMPANMPDMNGSGFGASGGNSANAGDGTMPANMPDMGGGFGASSGGSAGSDAENAGTGAPAGGAGSASGGRPEMPGGDFGGFGGGGGGFGGFNFGMGNDDVKLIYSDDDPDSYSNIFNNAKTKVTKKDQARLIESLRKLNAREDIESVVNTDEVIRYLAVHNFLCNDDSYTGMMVHNYYLYEENGQLSILPWDYNLGFGGFSASTDATSTVNSPIDNPVTGGTNDSRPLIAWIFSDEEALEAYHEAYDRFITETVENGWLASEISRVQEMITPYVESDPTAFYTMDEFSKAVDTLQTFCAKRGESIRGQLDGTIPSTSAGQRQSSALIDASDISTADMGSMNGAGGGGMPGGGGGFSMPGGGRGGFSMPDMGSQGGTAPEGFSMPEGMKMPEGMTMPGGTDGMGGSFGGSAGGPAGSTEATEAPVTAGPETMALPAEKAAEGETAEKPAETTRPERPSGMPKGRSFPGMEGTQADQSGLWIQAAVWSAVLLAALLIIRRAGSHNQ